MRSAAPPNGSIIADSVTFDSPSVRRPATEPVTNSATPPRYVAIACRASAAAANMQAPISARFGSSISAYACAYAAGRTGPNFPAAMYGITDASRRPNGTPSSSTAFTTRRAEEAAEHVVALAQRRRVEERVHARLHVARGRVAEQPGAHEHADAAEDGRGVHHHLGGVQ